MPEDPSSVRSPEGACSLPAFGHGEAAGAFPGGIEHERAS